MHKPVPGQRWISNTEPELGLGIIVNADRQRITVFYPASDEKRLYAAGNAPLTRVKFAPGDSIESVHGWRLKVSRCIERNGLVTYRGSTESEAERELEEVDLNHHLQFNKPQVRLFSGQLDPENWFSLRYDTLQIARRLQKSPAKGLLGGRTSLLPHQLYIAHEAANRLAPRILLADEVGLGKTIEAGLIIQHRLSNALASRVLIIVPASLLHQWLVEMLRRFNLHFSIFDEPRCLDSHAEQPFSSEQLILCSQEFFSRYPHRREQALQSEWDMVIVDEAHHLQWREQAPSPEYRFVEKLGKLSPSLILLTATPEQMGKESHFARLRLLDPDRFFSFERFLQEERQFQPIAQAARRLLAGDALDAALQHSLKKLLKPDNIDALLDQIAAGGHVEKARQELLAILIDHHGTGRILFRNSRQTVGGFPQRELHNYPLQKPAAKPAPSLRADPRSAWLFDKIRDLAGEKALLICKQGDTAVQLAQLLKNHAGIQTAVFHEGMSIIARDRAAAFFADPDSQARLLLCSEIGSEGRNFQFLRHLILFDLPENPDLLQQRIGRLDRIGQKHVIQLHVPYILNTPQHTLQQWYDRGLNAFRSNCSAAQRAYELQKNQLQSLLADYRQADIDAFIIATRELVEKIDQELHAGRDLLLELNSCRKEIAQSLIGEIISLEKTTALWPYMERLFDCFGVETEYHSPDCQILQPGNHLRIGHFPELPADGMTITTDRHTALAREDMQFLTWEHPLVAAAMDLVLSSETGNACISVVKNRQLQAGQYLLEALFVVECSAPPELQINRFLPATPIRLLVDQQGNDLTEMIDHQSLTAITPAVDSAQFQEFLDSQKPQINALLKISEKRVETHKNKLVRNSSQVMADTLGMEIKRLQHLQKINPNIKPEEIQQLQEIARTSLENIQASQIKLDAIRLLIIL